MKRIYFLFFVTLSCVFVSAQSPGGVSTGLSMWIKSNSGTSTTGGLVDTWSYANNGNSFASTGGNRPTLVSNGLNFNPVVRFTGGSKYMDGPTGVNAPLAQYDDDYTVIAVWKSNSTTTFQRIWEQRGNSCPSCGDAFALSTWDGSAPGPGAYGDELGVPPFSHTMTRSYAASVWNFSQFNLYNQMTGDLEITDLQNLGSGPAIYNTDPGATNGALIRAIDVTVNRMGLNYDGTGPLDGDIAEIIVYGGFPITSSTEQSKIFTYLALKYGIHLGVNLTSSAGSTIWNTTTNTGYNTSVFGLALDNASGLSVSQSNSMNTGSGNGAGQSGQGNLVISNPSALSTNQTFLIVGNNNGALTESTTELPTAAAGSQRLGREWKVQRTGNPGTVTTAFNLSGLTITGTNPVNFRLMVDQDGNGDFTNGTIRYYTAATYAGNVVTFNNITLNNTEVFALITNATGSTPLPVNWKSFTAKAVNANVVLNWAVDNNETALEYVVEHSTDGVNYSTVGTVVNQASVKSYSFVYPSLTSGNHYFRIRQVDMDGKGTYSKIATVKGGEIIIRLLNNPVRGNYVDLQITAVRSSKATIRLQSVGGMEVTLQNVNIIAGSNRIRVPMEKAASGNYLLKIQTDDLVVTEKILKL